MSKEIPHVIDGPFTQVFASYTNKERRQIHNLMSRYFQIMKYDKPTRDQLREAKALAWVIRELQNLEVVD